MSDGRQVNWSKFFSPHAFSPREYTSTILDVYGEPDKARIADTGSQRQNETTSRSGSLIVRGETQSRFNNHWNSGKRGVGTAATDVHVPSGPASESFSSFRQNQKECRRSSRLRTGGERPMVTSKWRHDTAYRAKGIPMINLLEADQRRVQQWNRTGRNKPHSFIQRIVGLRLQVPAARTLQVSSLILKLSVAGHKQFFGNVDR